jgi:hypothetical protein
LRGRRREKWVFAKYVQLQTTQEEMTMPDKLIVALQGIGAAPEEFKQERREVAKAFT